MIEQLLLQIMLIYAGEQASEQVTGDNGYGFRIDATEPSNAINAFSGAEVRQVMPTGPVLILLQGSSWTMEQESKLPGLCVAADPVSVRPNLEILPVQMITLALAVVAGRDPGVFELARKITTTE